jgi:hypothetical protein
MIQDHDWNANAPPWTIQQEGGVPYHRLSLLAISDLLPNEQKSTINNSTWNGVLWLIVENGKALTERLCLRGSHQEFNVACYHTFSLPASAM